MTANENTAGLVDPFALVYIYAAMSDEERAAEDAASAIEAAADNARRAKKAINNGTGHIHSFQHVQNGVCFGCNGSGKDLGYSAETAIYAAAGH